MSYTQATISVEMGDLVISQTADISLPVLNTSRDSVSYLVETVLPHVSDLAEAGCMFCQYFL